MGGGNMERKAHLVKWEIVCGDKGRGGLGLRRLGLMNKALLGKWIWRYACERENLWKQVILAKYGQEEYGLELRVGKGNRSDSGLMCGVRDQNSDQGGWNLRFLRNFNDWEVGMVGDLLLKLRGLRPTLEEDSISWKGGKAVDIKSRWRTVV
ncbi:hypothetical protein CK203_041243 [Vitis vinifera]|uniref:Uncharacterized protein n=1 Tax=Vitis vinifera TaxID=29760 RepID=A0A438HJB2_VITVI|nr:hypothetical protein CK203_041243 [Vitis vinifera]